MSKKYRIRWAEVTYEGALDALKNKRYVYASFGLTDQEWEKFSQFF